MDDPQGIWGRFYGRGISGRYGGRGLWTLIQFISVHEYLLESVLMNPEPVPDTNPDTIVSTAFHRFNGGVLLNIPCNLCINKTLFVNTTITLLDFGDNGSITESYVKFFDCYLEGYVVNIVALDLKSGELIKRKHRLNNEDLPCDWVLTEPDIFNPKNKKDELLEFYF